MMRDLAFDPALIDAIRHDHARYPDRPLTLLPEELDALLAAIPESKLRVELCGRLNEPTTCQVWLGDELLFDGATREPVAPEVATPEADTHTRLRPNCRCSVDPLLGHEYLTDGVGETPEAETPEAEAPEPEIELWSCLTCRRLITRNDKARVGEPYYIHVARSVAHDHVALRGAEL